MFSHVSALKPLGNELSSYVVVFLVSLSTVRPSFPLRQIILISLPSFLSGELKFSAAGSLLADMLILH